MKWCGGDKINVLEQSKTTEKCENRNGNDGDDERHMYKKSWKFHTKITFNFVKKQNTSKKLFLHLKFVSWLLKDSSYHKHRLLLINWHLRDFIKGFSLKLFCSITKRFKFKFFLSLENHKIVKKTKKEIVGRCHVVIVLLFVEQLVLSWCRQFWDNTSQCSIFRTQSFIFLLVLIELLFVNNFFVSKKLLTIFRVWFCAKF